MEAYPKDLRLRVFAAADRTSPGPDSHAWQLAVDGVAIGASIIPCVARSAARVEGYEYLPLRRAAEQQRFGREVARKMVGAMEAGTLKVMSFNIRGFSYRGDGINRWENRAALNVAPIERYAPDLIGLQELRA